MIIKKLLFSFILLIICIFCKAQKESVPFIGAEVFIEPGQTSEEIDTWFKIKPEETMVIWWK